MSRPAEPDPAAVGVVEAGDAVEDGGLAGAVGADQADNLPFMYLRTTPRQATMPPKCLLRPSILRSGTANQVQPACIGLPRLTVLVQANTVVKCESAVICGSLPNLNGNR